MRGAELLTNSHLECEGKRLESSSIVGRSLLGLIRFLFVVVERGGVVVVVEVLVGLVVVFPVVVVVVLVEEEDVSSGVGELRCSMSSFRFIKFGFGFPVVVRESSSRSASSGSMRDSMGSGSGVDEALPSLGRFSSSIKNSPMVSASAEFSVGCWEAITGFSVALSTFNGVVEVDTVVVELGAALGVVLSIACTSNFPST